MTLKLKRISFKHLILSASLIFVAGQTIGQTVFWSDNFDAPAGGTNNNNAGVGWSASTNTPGGGQNTSLFGLNNSWIIGNDGNACVSGNKLYIKAIGTTNSYISDVYTDKLKATPAISTVGVTGISLTFTWRLVGVTGSDYGQVGLSNDGGTTWNWLSTQYSDQPNCTQATIAIPAQYQGISNFKIAYRYISNATSCADCDPPFNIDDIQLTGTTSSCTPPTVSAGSNVSICPGGSVAIGGTPTATGGSEAGAYVYSWSPATNLSSTSVANPTANPSATTTYTVTVYKTTPSCSATSSVTVTVNTPQTLSVSPSGNQSICPGGSVVLTAANGFTGYSWTTPSGTQAGQSVTASTVGSYTVSANDANNCLSTAAAINVTLGSSQSITVTPSGPLNFCPGGSVTLTAAAGYTTYTWSNSQIGQSITVTESGTYSVIGSGAGCGGQSSDIIVTVNNPAPLSVTADGPLVLCQGADVVLTAEAGFSNYMWSDNSSGQSLTVSSAGNFVVSAEDVNGCQVQSTVQTVSLDAPFTIDVNPSGTIGLCEGDNVVLTAETGYTNYVWSNSTNGTTLNVTSGGAYSVSAQNANGCSGTSDAIFINETIAPNSSFTYLQVEDLYQVNFTSSFDADTYLWNFGNNQTSTEANPSFTFPFDNTYPVTLITTNACGSDTVTIDVVVIKTGIENLNSVSSFSISPNPGSDYFRIKGNSIKPQSLTVQVYTMTGQVIQHKSISVKGAFMVEFDSNELAAGVYMIRVSDSTSEITQKWIKQ